MSETATKRFLIPAALLATALMSAVIWFMIEDRNTILRDGSEIVLKSEPIDPRDLLRGRYVTLTYPAQMLSAELLGDIFTGPEPIESGDPLYLYFTQQDDGLHTVSEVSASKPSDLTGWMEVDLPYRPVNAVSILVPFPIDRYYAHEKLAPEIEARMRDGALTEVVIALHEGRAQLKAFRQDGETVLVEPLY